MKTILKAGKYWVGDPCYCYPDEEWLNLCNKLHKKNEKTHELEHLDKDGIILEYNLISFIVISTAYGDGYYSLKHRNNILGGL